ncbi:MAG: hypothetical protein KAR45_10600 [Desulfobacteraceae bacterium]|nr:hypothetical protein [Desulfobacteraceae bacterium]
MNYFSIMIQVLGLKTSHIKQGTSLKQLQYHCMINVLISGLIYGMSALYFSGIILAQKGLAGGDLNSAKIVLAGISVAFLMHAGASLSIWVFFRGIGAGLNFLDLYMNIGKASISFWPLAPCIAAMQAGFNHYSLFIAIFIFFLYALIVNLRLIQAVSNLSNLKMIIASAVTLMYISCFLYLWL